MTDAPAARTVAGFDPATTIHMTLIIFVIPAFAGMTALGLP